MKKVVRVVLLIVVVNFAITSYIQRFDCEDLTETQLFKELGRNFIWQFKTCELPLK